MSVLVKIKKNGKCYGRGYAALKQDHCILRVMRRAVNKLLRFFFILKGASDYEAQWFSRRIELLRRVH